MRILVWIFRALNVTNGLWMLTAPYVWRPVMKRDNTAA